MAEKGITATMQDMAAALRKRLVTQGVALSETQLHTLAIDCINVVSVHTADATSNASTELVVNKVRPFVSGV